MNQFDSIRPIGFRLSYVRLVLMLVSIAPSISFSEYELSKACNDEAKKESRDLKSRHASHRSETKTVSFNKTSFRFAHESFIVPRLKVGAADSSIKKNRRKIAVSLIDQQAGENIASDTIEFSVHVISDTFRVNFATHYRAPNGWEIIDWKKVEESLSWEDDCRNIDLRQDERIFGTINHQYNRNEAISVSPGNGVNDITLLWKKYNASLAIRLNQKGCKKFQNRFIACAL